MKINNMKKQLFTTTDGKECRPVNPHKQYVNGDINQFWLAFKSTAPTYPIHSDKPIEAGEFEGEVVEQFWYEKNGKGIWVTFPAGATSYDLELDAKTRKVVQPITHVSENYKPVDFTEFQVQLRCCLIIKDGFDNEWMHDFYADYKEDFGVKLSVKEWAEDFFQDVSLDTHTYCLVSKAGKSVQPVPVKGEGKATVEEMALLRYGDKSSDEFMQILAGSHRIAFKQGWEAHALASSNMVELEKVEMIFNKVKVSGKPYHLMPFDEALADILKQIKNLTIKS